MLYVLLKIRGFMEHPGHVPWNKVRFRMTSDGQFRLDVKYPDAA